ncbi:hypothetical protein [Hyalangium versicolor]|uniref:hypothetical protein n=1 Tax=Hyalangium versicolor TaxID=2861190 RepID=UPI001CCA1F09|nr:hypothetical protein [Hyalangium versicolor]
MRYHLGHVVLDLPLVLVDETVYTFQNKQQGLSLVLSFEPPVPGMTPDDVVDELQESLRKGYQGMLIQHLRKQRTFLGEPAAQAFLQLALALGGGEIHLLAVNGAKQGMLLKLLTGQETQNGEGLAMFEHILGSAAPAQSPWSRKAEKPGYVRRQAGALTLEMPEVLPAPRSFSFGTQDRSVRLMLEFEEGAPEEGAPATEDILPSQEPGARLERLVAEEEPFVAASLRGFTGHWEWVSRQGRQDLAHYAVRRLSVQVAGGQRFRALGIAKASGAATLESVWAQLTTTLRPGD